METPSDYFDSWIKTQQQAFATLREQAQQMQSYYQHAASASDNPFASWGKAAFQAFSNGADANLAKDTFSKTLYGNEAMQKLFELWQSMLNALRDKNMDPASYSDLIDPDKIKQLISQLFSFDLDAMSQLQKQVAQYSEIYQKFSKPWIEKWTDAAKSQSSNFMQGNYSHSELQPEALMLQAQAMYNMFDNATGKMFSTPAVGKNRERMELLSQFAKALSLFATNNIEYHKLMQATGSDAMQEVANALVAKFQAGEKIEKFDEFFALWIDTNEKAFNHLFQSKVFSQKRNALTEAGFKARKIYNEIVENQLVEFPIARRSEIDEVYKIIYELRKQVKSLESQVLELKSPAKEQQS